MKWLRRIAVVLVLLAAVAAGYVYHRLGSLEATRVTADVLMLEGLGGNVAVLRTGAGTVVVDSMTFPVQGRRIREAAEAFADGPVLAVINTHYHADHSHGNPGLPREARFVATERTRDLMLEIDGEFWRDKDPAAIPAETFEGEHTLALGGKTIRLVHTGPAHTSGDLVALFVEDGVVHMGDLLFNGYYPNIDLEGGGSVAAWPQALARTLELEFDHVIPGHGQLCDRRTIERFAEFMAELGRAGHEAVAGGLGLEETLESVELTHDDWLEPLGVPLVMKLDRDFVLTRAWQEASGAGRR